MVGLLSQLFNKLGYTRDNGLYITSSDKELILKNFPFRISRILADVIKPYAIFNIDNGIDIEDHISPINNPIILFYDNPSQSDYSIIARHSFNLSRAPIVVISNNSTNSIDIFHGFDFTNSSGNELLSKINVDIDLLSVRSLRTGKGWGIIFEEYFKRSKTVDYHLLSNITDARRILVAKEDNFPEGNLPPEVANRLIGRLIFIRYLIDRNVSFSDYKPLAIKDEFISGNSEEKERRREVLNEILLDHNEAYKLFEYISQKFKGDLFPLVVEEEGISQYEKSIVGSRNLEVLYHLFNCSKFFTGSEVRGYSVQPSLFNIYDFEIIPVELISNIYESFLGSANHAKNENNVIKLSKQKQVKAYYTPPFLVDYVLSQTVNPHLEKAEGSNCRVLDPSCGSGIFLVETLRQLIEKEIQINHSGEDSVEIPNGRLWQLLSENIFGIDIDLNAIEVTTFSLYLTLLDYKRHPREIESFEFKSIKESNLFGGKDADFFNKKHYFNTLFSDKVKLDFIIGNPPWGHVSSSNYKAYVLDRKIEEALLELPEVLTIGNKEISQAFMVRVSDFVGLNQKTKFCFIVTSKNLYNSDKSAKQWRKYFLSTFKVNQCFDLTGVNNKVAGGNHLFENARQPAAILLYEKSSLEGIQFHDIEHISARANKYYNSFKTIVIEKRDIKRISQNQLLIDDELWKIILYGNYLDYQLVKRLGIEFKSITEEFEEKKLVYRGGFKAVDSGVKLNNKKNTERLWGYKYLELDSNKDLQQYLIRPSITFKEKLDQLLREQKIKDDYKVAQLPDDRVFRGKKLLIKKGLDNEINHKTTSAFSDETVIFSSTVAAISTNSGDISEEVESFLFGVCAIFNSSLFTYLLFMTSSSFGKDRNRFNFVEFLSKPFAIDEELIKLSRQLHEECKSADLQIELRIQTLKKELDQKIFSLFRLNEVEQSLIDYALNVSLPIYKRANRQNEHYVFKELRVSNISVLKDYCQIFIDHFSIRFDSKENQTSFNVDVYLESDFIAINFLVSKFREERLKINYNSSLSDTISKIGELGYSKVSSELFIRQDVRGFNENSFYIIKPNEYKNWHQAVAYSDLIEFIEAIAAAELKHNKLR